MYAITPKMHTRSAFLSLPIIGAVFFGLATKGCEMVPYHYVYVLVQSQGRATLRDIILSFKR